MNEKKQDYSDVGQYLSLAEVHAHNLFIELFFIT